MNDASELEATMRFLYRYVVRKIISLPVRPVYWIPDLSVPQIKQKRAPRDPIYSGLHVPVRGSQTVRAPRSSLSLSEAMYVAFYSNFAACGAYCVPISRVSFLDLFGPIAGVTNPIM